MVASAVQRLETSDRVAKPLYIEDDIVRMTELHVIAQVRRVHRSIGTLPRYDVTDEDGEIHLYVPEIELYPDILKAR